jgi:hypothetical protein
MNQKKSAARIFIDIGNIDNRDLKNMKNRTEQTDGCATNTDPESIVKRILDFVQEYAKISPNWDKSDDGEKYTGPDVYQLLDAADLIKSGRKVLQCHSDWGSGCYGRYSDNASRKVHDDLVADILKFYR